MVEVVGKIDTAMFSRISTSIITNEVVITKKQDEHAVERHGNVFEKYKPHIEDILLNPDWIIRDSKRPNTALILKTFKGEEQKNVNIVLRLIVEGENPEYKNSIITIWEMNDKKMKQAIRNKEVVYNHNCSMIE